MFCKGRDGSIPFTRTNKIIMKVLKCIRWDSQENIERCISLLGKNIVSEESNVGTVGHFVFTPDGHKLVSYGDFIIKTLNGSFDVMSRVDYEINNVEEIK